MITLFVAALIRVDRFFTKFAEERQLISLGAAVAERGRTPATAEERRALEAYEAWLLR